MALFLFSPGMTDYKLDSNEALYRVKSTNPLDDYCFISKRDADIDELTSAARFAWFKIRGSAGYRTFKGIEKVEDGRMLYLDSLAEDYGLDSDFVYAIADILGPNQDHDGLISAIEDYIAYYD